MDDEPGLRPDHGSSVGASAATPGADAQLQRLVLVHGFTQNRHCWSPVDHLLAGSFDVVTVDAPGHGDAGQLAMDLPTAGERYGRDHGPAVWVGYSMGGRLALHVALARPEAVTALVLVGASPGIADATERQTRRWADDALADRIETMGVDRFIDQWLSQPLFANLDASNDQRAQRTMNSASGLASSLRLAGTGAQEPLWDRLGAITCPVLLVTGGADAKFTALAHTMAPLFGGTCDVVEVPGAGHSVHLEQPETFAGIVTRWVTATGSSQAAGTP
jgi:2-succinyl-6-hydroxy-2,4-cyclohexadiene-1-carboxylate synthase